MSGPLSLVYPVLAQVLWTFVVYIHLGVRRRRALVSRTTRPRDIALTDEAWPQDARQVSNNLRNQFESPVIFYVLCGVATYVGATDLLMAALAWIYVMFRVIHTYVHTTSNRVPVRGLVFAIGIIPVSLMWIIIVIRLLVA